MRPTDANVVSLLASTRQIVFWEEFTFTLANGSEVMYSTKDPDFTLPVVLPTPGPPPPAELWIEDTFTGAVETTLATHVGEVGATWSGFSGPSNFELDGAGNVIYAPASSGTVGASGLPTTGTTDYYFRTSAVFLNIPSVGTELARFGLEEPDLETGWSVELFANPGDSTLSAGGYFFGVSGGGVISDVDTEIAPSSSHVELYVTVTEGRTAMNFYVNDVLIGTVTSDSPPANPEDLLMTIANGVGASKVRVGPVEGGYL